MSLMKDDGCMKEDLKLPCNDLGKEIEDKFNNGDSFLVRMTMNIEVKWIFKCGLPLSSGSV